MTLLLFLGVNQVRSATLRVPSVYPSIQTAIDAAANGDTILVSPGTYNEGIDFSGKAIAVASRFLETGNSNDVWGTVIAPPFNVSGATAMSGENTNSSLIGFTISRCQGLNVAAVYCYQGSLSVLNCRLIDNQCPRPAVHATPSSRHS